MAAEERRSRPTAAMLASIAFGITAVALGSVGWRWYSYVTAGDSPYDEIGIEVNSRLPDPLRIWGCTRILERFPRAYPPYGCEKGRL